MAHWRTFVLVLSFGFWLAGCKSSRQQNASDLELGPHGGVLLSLSPSGKHAEWTHQDSEVSVFLDDFEVTQISSVQLKTTQKGNREEFPLRIYGQRWKVSHPALKAPIAPDREFVLVVEDDSGIHSAKLEFTE